MRHKVEKHLIEKLKCPKVKNKIIEITANAYKDAIDIISTLDSNNIVEHTEEGPCGPYTHYEYKDETLSFFVHDKSEDAFFDVAIFKSEFIKKLQQIEYIFENEVLKTFNGLLIISAKELYDEYLNIALPARTISQIKPEILYTLFIERVHRKTLKVRSFLYPLCETLATGHKYVGFIDENQCALKDRIHEQYIFEEGWVSNWARDCLSQFKWQKNGVDVNIVSDISEINEEEWKTRKTKVSLQLSGSMSELCFDENKNTFSRLLHTAINSISMLTGDFHPSWDGKEYYLCPRSDGNILLGLTEKEFLDIAHKIIKYIDSYFIASDKKSMDRRINNAICLLIESDAQDNNSVSLSLSIAAIEALLGEKGNEMAEKLTVLVGRFLEPTLEHRANAEEFFKKLYDARSRTLHGESLEKENELCLKARHLASAVLDSTISRRDFRRRLGYEPEKPDELIKELKATKYKDGTPVGSEEIYNVRNYWM